MRQNNAVEGNRDKHTETQVVIEDMVRVEILQTRKAPQYTPSPVEISQEKLEMAMGLRDANNGINMFPYGVQNIPWGSNDSEFQLEDG